MINKTAPPVGWERRVKREAEAMGLRMEANGERFTVWAGGCRPSNRIVAGVPWREAEQAVKDYAAEAIEVERAPVTASPVPVEGVTVDGLRAEFDAIESGGFNFARRFAIFCYRESITVAEAARRIDRPKQTIGHHVTPFTKIAKVRTSDNPDLDPLEIFGSITADDYAEAKSAKPKPVERPTLTVVPDAPELCGWLGCVLLAGHIPANAHSLDGTLPGQDDEPEPTRGELALVVAPEPESDEPADDWSPISHNPDVDAWTKLGCALARDLYGNTQEAAMVLDELVESAKLVAKVAARRAKEVRRQL